MGSRAPEWRRGLSAAEGDSELPVALVIDVEGFPTSHISTNVTETKERFT
jgi:hypothetical protein